METVGASGGSLGGQPGALTLRFFFYGTLMGGGVRDSGKHLALKLVEPRAAMKGHLYAVGASFPALVHGDDDVVRGELWEAEDEDHALEVLTVCDAIEGYRPDDRANSLYLREQVRLLQPAGELAWTYVWNGAQTRYLQRIHGGDWRRWLQEPYDPALGRRTR